VADFASVCKTCVKIALKKKKKMFPIFLLIIDSKQIKDSFLPKIYRFCGF